MIGLFSSFILLSLYSRIEKKRVKSLGKIKYPFMFIVIFSSVVVMPSTQWFDWIIYLMFFYTVLDDMKTQTVFVPIYAIIVFLLFFNGQTLEEFIFAIIVFLICFIISKKTKETFFSLGDAYAALALAFWLDGYFLLAIVLSSLLASVFVMIMELWSQRAYTPYTPYMVLGSLIVKESWYIQEALLFLVIIYIITSLFFLRYKLTPGVDNNH